MFKGGVTYASFLFISLGGKAVFFHRRQVHNSSAYPIGRKGNPQYEEDSERSFESVKAIGGNTIAVPICWDAFLSRRKGPIMPAMCIR